MSRVARLQHTLEEMRRKKRKKEHTHTHTTTAGRGELLGQKVPCRNTGGTPVVCQNVEHSITRSIPEVGLIVVAIPLSAHTHASVGAWSFASLWVPLSSSKQGWGKALMFPPVLTHVFLIHCVPRLSVYCTFVERKALSIPPPLSIRPPLQIRRPRRLGAATSRSPCHPRRQVSFLTHTVLPAQLGHIASKGFRPQSHPRKMVQVGLDMIVF